VISTRARAELVESRRRAYERELRRVRAEAAYEHEMKAARPHRLTEEREPYPIVVRRARAAYDSIMKERR
jgi:hypothetical protein